LMCLFAVSFPMFFRSVFVIASGVLADYSNDRGLEYAKLAGAAYCSADKLQQWSCGQKCTAAVTSVQVCRGATTKAFIGLWDGKCIVSFEGTRNLKGFAQDLQFLQRKTQWSACGNCAVHSGFLEEYNSHAQCVQTKLNELGCGTGSSVRITGHSLGAATASLAALNLENNGWHIEEIYTFGMPRTGDSLWAQAFNSKFVGRSFRVTHGKDPVPNLPPDALLVDWGFEHVVPEIYYKGLVAEGFETCDEAHQNERCVEQYWNVPWHLTFDLPDHLTYMEQQTSFFGCGGLFSNNTVDDVIV